VDPSKTFFRKYLPMWLALKVVRWKNIILPFLFFNFCRTFPNAARKTINKRTAKVLRQGAGATVDPDFQPTYNPWEQRMCICPDADFFECLNSGKASIATGTIENITADTIALKGPNGKKTLKPDIIITATGLKLQIAGGTKITVDKEPYNISDKFLWKGVMVQDLPNACVSLGYTNASWTLGADATAKMVVRMLKYMKRTGQGVAVPRPQNASDMKSMSPFNLNSTYVEKGQGDLPRAGDKGPWRARRNYMSDLWDATHGDLKDGIQFYKKVST
jgi:cation diffusion facilitator CzcD-associated flavoprotein CzcO